MDFPVRVQSSEKFHLQIQDFLKKLRESLGLFSFVLCLLHDCNKEIFFFSCRFDVEWSRPEEGEVT